MHYKNTVECNENHEIINFCDFKGVEDVLDQKCLCHKTGRRIRRRPQWILHHSRARVVQKSFPTQSPGKIFIKRNSNPYT